MINRDTSYRLARLGSLLVWLALLLAGCVLPYPDDYRATLTVQVTEINPTPTGFEFSHSAGSPAALSTPEAEQTSLPAELEGDSPYYAVIHVATGNFLNVRQGAGTDQDIIQTLDANARDIKLTGRRDEINGDRWVEINLPEGGTGWVAADFLTPQVPAGAFCGSARIRTLVRDFQRALTEKDGETLAALVNPQRDLTLWRREMSSSLTLTAQETNTIFTSTREWIWGTNPENDEPRTGSFSRLVLPELEPVFLGQHAQACNSLEFATSTGPTSLPVTWPEELSNLNYLAFYLPAGQSESQSWLAWTMGVEVLNGQPYLTYLIQYAGEN
jgi:hypothetical protein